MLMCLRVLYEDEERYTHAVDISDVDVMLMLLRRLWVDAVNWMA